MWHLYPWIFFLRRTEIQRLFIHLSSSETSPLTAHDLHVLLSNNHHCCRHVPQKYLSQEAYTGLYGNVERYSMRDWISGNIAVRVRGSTSSCSDLLCVMLPRPRSLWIYWCWFFLDWMEGCRKRARASRTALTWLFTKSPCGDNVSIQVTVKELHRNVIALGWYVCQRRGPAGLKINWWDVMDGDQSERRQTSVSC